MKTKVKNGKTYANIKSLYHWDKNPKSIKAEDSERLRRQVLELGQYKPLLVTVDGMVIGGNQKLPIYKEEGIKDVWVSIIEVERVNKNYVAKIDGKLQNKEYNTELELYTIYALSDNDQAGYYLPEELLELSILADIDLSTLDVRVSLDDPVPLSTLVETEKPPSEFKEKTHDIQVTHKCPSCGYEWK